MAEVRPAMNRDEAIGVVEEVARKAVGFGESSRVPISDSPGDGVLYVCLKCPDVFSELGIRWKEAMMVLATSPRTKADGDG